MKLALNAFLTAAFFVTLLAFAAALLIFVGWIYDTATSRRGDRIDRERRIYELGRQDEAADRGY